MMDYSSSLMKKMVIFVYEDVQITRFRKHISKYCSLFISQGEGI